MHEPVTRTALQGLPEPRRGKVRDVYDLGRELLVVATDRISAFDVVLSPGIPEKGVLLTRLSSFWFGKFGDIVPNHLLQTDGRALPGDPRPAQGPPRGPRRPRTEVPRRAVRVRRTRLPRGLRLEGLPDELGGLRPPAAAGAQGSGQASRADLHPGDEGGVGHDENVSFAAMAGAIASPSRGASVT